MFPFDSTGDVAAATRAKLAAPQTNTPGQRLTKWATTPIGLQNNVKTPSQVMQPGVKTEAPKAVAPAGPDFSEMIKRSGGNPNAFHTEGSQLFSSRSPQEIQADVTAHPPITTDTGRALKVQADIDARKATVKPAAPVASVPTVGVRGAPEATRAAPAPAWLGSQYDPARAALHEGLRQAQEDQARYGQGRWMSPNGDTTNASGPPVWVPNDAAERIAAHTNALANYNQTDPKAQIGLLKGIAGDREASDLYLAGKGVSRAEINARPQPGLPFDPSTGQDINQYLSGQAQAGTSTAETLASLPYEHSPQVQAALQAYINKQHPTPESWKQASRRPQPASEYGYSGPLPGLFSGPAKLFQAGSDRFFGDGQNDQDDPVLAGLMQRYGLKPPSHSLTSANAGVSNPY